MSEDNLEFTDDDKRLAWDVNALLMALNTGSVELYESMLDESENLPGLLVMSTATLKSMVDYLLEIINESGIVELSFEDMIAMTAEFLTSLDGEE